MAALGATPPLTADQALPSAPAAPRPAPTFISGVVAFPLNNASDALVRLPATPPPGSATQKGKGGSTGTQPMQVKTPSSLAGVGLWLGPTLADSRHDIVELLVDGDPADVDEYSEHIFKICTLLYEGAVMHSEMRRLEAKLARLVDMLPRFTTRQAHPAASRLYVVAERSFDVLIYIVTSLDMMRVATLAVRFLTSLMMALNYWEIYNLLRWRPAIYQFLVLINFDFGDCYARFMSDYSATHNVELPIAEERLRQVAAERIVRERAHQLVSPVSSETGDLPGYTYDPELFDDHDKFVLNQLSMSSRSYPRKRMVADHKLAAHKVVKKQDGAEGALVRSSNYDPDVVHECHLPSADEPGEPCLRRFSRKYELIRHQETVHSKRKKLFKCFVCVKQNPNMGPRIFTRYDTLAKHIRVNHRISGKEAKAEVAYSKKHAEIIHDTSSMHMPLARREFKGEYEFLVVLDRKGASKDGSDDAAPYDDLEGSSCAYNHSQDDDDMDDL